MGKMRWTSEAQWWIEEIRNHIARDNPQAAQRVVEGIRQRAKILRSFPEVGHLYKPDCDEEQPVRILLYGHYRIAYSILPSRDVDILGVYHGALDITRFLG